MGRFREYWAGEGLAPPKGNMAGNPVAQPPESHNGKCLAARLRELLKTPQEAKKIVKGLCLWRGYGAGDGAKKSLTPRLGRN